MVKKNGTVRLITLIVSLAILFAGIVTAWALYGENVRDNTADLAELKKDGCKPANKTTLDVALIQKDITIIQEDIEDMRSEQQAGFEAILKRLPE